MDRSNNSRQSWKLNYLYCCLCTLDKNLNTPHKQTLTFSLGKREPRPFIHKRRCCQEMPYHSQSYCKATKDTYFIHRYVISTNHENIKHTFRKKFILLPTTEKLSSKKFLIIFPSNLPGCLGADALTDSLSRGLQEQNCGLIQTSKSPLRLKVQKITPLLACDPQHSRQESAQTQCIFGNCSFEILN